MTRPLPLTPPLAEPAATTDGGRYAYDTGRLALPATFLAGAGNPLGRPTPAELAEALDVLVRQHAGIEQAASEAGRHHRETLVRAALANERLDDAGGGHAVRTALLSETLALLLGERGPAARRLRHAALLHDIGMLGLPDDLVGKTTPMSTTEAALVATHTHIGAHLLGGTSLPFFQLAADVALAHHERYDGSGYPFQLRGLAIPQPARIVAVADAFDALTSDGMGQTALSDEDALAQMAAQRGRGFDPRIIDCLMAHSRDIIDMRNRVRRSHPAMEDLLDVGTVEGLT